MSRLSGDLEIAVLLRSRRRDQTARRTGIAKFVMPVTEPKFEGRYLPATIRGNNGHADLISFR